MREDRCVRPAGRSPTGCVEEALLEDSGMVGTRDNRCEGRENGGVESSQRYPKEAIGRALMLPSHRDIDGRAACGEFEREIVMRHNRRNAAAFRIDREQLVDLPLLRGTDFIEEETCVIRCSTFTVRGIFYSAPSLSPSGIKGPGISCI